MCTPEAPWLFVGEVVAVNAAAVEMIEVEICDNFVKGMLGLDPRELELR